MAIVLRRLSFIAECISNHLAYLGDYSDEF
jgi:hypothetical protein